MRLTSIPLIKKDIKKNFSKSKKLVKQPNVNFSKLEHYQPNQRQVEHTKTLKKILGGGALALAVLGSIFAKKSIDGKTTKYVKTLTKSMNLHFNTNFKPENLKSVISGKELLKELKSLKKENYVATVENLKNGTFIADLHSHSNFSDGHAKVSTILDQVAEYADFLKQKNGKNFKFFENNQN